jgi:hypothetical protein
MSLFQQAVAIKTWGAIYAKMTLKLNPHGLSPAPNKQLGTPPEPLLLGKLVFSIPIKNGRE